MDIKIEISAEDVNTIKKVLAWLAEDLSSDPPKNFDIQDGERTIGYGEIDFDDMVYFIGGEGEACPHCGATHYALNDAMYPKYGYCRQCGSNVKVKVGEE